MPQINHDELEDWSLRAVQELQEFCDDAQVAAGNPDGEDKLPGVRALLLEHERIMKGQPAWHAKIGAQAMAECDNSACVIDQL